MLLQPLQKEGEAVSEVFDRLVSRQSSAHRVCVIAAAEAPDGITQDIGINVLDIVPLLGVNDQLFDLLGPPQVVALGERIAFEYVGVELHFGIVGQQKRLDDQLHDLLKEIATLVNLGREAFADPWDHAVVYHRQDLIDVAEAIVKDAVGDSKRLQDLTYRYALCAVLCGNVLGDLDDPI